jgi:hypothetical protein
MPTHTNERRTEMTEISTSHATSLTPNQAEKIAKIENSTKTWELVRNVALAAFVAIVVMVAL